MICPYCNQEMQKGIISGYRRGDICWKAGDKCTAFWERVSDDGRITAAKLGLGVFKITAYYCEQCKKMIFDTDIIKI